MINHALDTVHTPPVPLSLLGKNCKVEAPKLSSEKPHDMNNQHLVKPVVWKQNHARRSTSPDWHWVSGHAAVRKIGKIAPYASRAAATETPSGRVWALFMQWPLQTEQNTSPYYIHLTHSISLRHNTINIKTVKWPLYVAKMVQHHEMLSSRAANNQGGCTSNISREC